MATKYFGSMGTTGGSGSLADPYNLVALNAAWAAGVLAAGTALALDIVGSGTELLINTPMLLSGSTGGIVRCAQSGAQWQARDCEILAPGGWTKTATATNVYQCSATGQVVGGIAAIAWENDTTYTRVLGQYLADVLATVDSTVGSTWTGPLSAGSPTTFITIVHAYDNTNPAIDGKVYQRSYTYGDSNLSSVVVDGATLMDMYALGIRWQGPPNAIDSGTAAYAAKIIPSLAGSNIINCFAQTGDKHVFASIEGVSNGIGLMDSCRAGMCNPYSNTVGATTVYVGFAASGQTGINLTFNNCSCTANVGLIGSSTGTIDQGQPVMYFHGDPAPFSTIQITGCTLPLLPVQCGYASNIAGTRMGSAILGNSTLANCIIDYQSVNCAAGTTVNINNTVYAPTGICTASQGPCQMGGTVVLNQCTLDLRNSGGGNSQLYTSIDANGHSLTIKNSLLLSSGADYNLMVLEGFDGLRDTVVWTNNMLVNPTAADGNSRILAFQMTNYSGLIAGNQMKLTTMKANSLANAATTEYDGATVATYVGPTYRPVQPTPVRSTSGGDVGVYQWSPGIRPIDPLAIGSGHLRKRNSLLRSIA